ncbi:MAG: hypothetical protein LBR08_08545 [Bacteroidales bacterium]|nr:hypothetical protein [Bacteroidales bacterium]
MNINNLSLPDPVYPVGARRALPLQCAVVAAMVRAMVGALRATPLQRRHLFCRAVPQGRDVHNRGCNEAQPVDTDAPPICKP